MFLQGWRYKIDDRSRSITPQYFIEHTNVFALFSVEICENRKEERGSLRARLRRGERGRVRVKVRVRVRAAPLAKTCPKPLVFVYV